MGGLVTIDLLEANRSELLDDVLVRLCNILQLSSTQFSLAESHYHAICEWLGHEESELNQFDPDLYPHPLPPVCRSYDPRRRAPG